MLTHLVTYSVWLKQAEERQIRVGLQLPAIQRGFNYSIILCPKHPEIEADGKLEILHDTVFCE